MMAMLRHEGPRAVAFTTEMRQSSRPGSRAAGLAVATEADTSMDELCNPSDLPSPAQRRQPADPPATRRGRGRKEQAEEQAPQQAHRGGGRAVDDAGSGGGGYEAYESVVKVFVIHCEPNFSLPWQRKRQYASGSSGFIIPGRRILTNAHCVADHTQVKVKRRGSETKYVAQVLAVATEGDMALLTVEDEAFWQDSEPVQFGNLPQLQDAVTVVGYPIGGDTMSVTSGVVSRIEVTSYVHGAAELLGIQIDAAINSGNSGGPAFNDQGECVGIAFQSLKHEDAENIGYIIPTPVVQHFIHDYETNGQYTGFPCLGIEWQKLENPHLRNALKMKPEQKGVMIRRIEPTAAVSKVLATCDVLMSFDGVPIANDGTVPFRSGERIGFSYLISQKYADEPATLEVLKKGKQHITQIKLQAPVRLVPYHIKNQPPSYFIIAGLVFTNVTVPYLKSEYGKEYDFDAPVRLLEKMMHSMAETEDQQVVVLGHVLAADINIGYEDIINTQVMTLNGQKVNNLRELVRMVDSSQQEYLNFDLDYNQKVVLHTNEAKQSTKEILAMHCIAQDRSSDLLDMGARAAGTAGAAKAGPSSQPEAAAAPAGGRGRAKKGQQEQAKQKLGAEEEEEEEPAEAAAPAEAPAAVQPRGKREPRQSKQQEAKKEQWGKEEAGKKETEAEEQKQKKQKTKDEGERKQRERKSSSRYADCII